MAAMGVDAGVEYAKTGKKVSGYTDTGVTLIAAKPVAGVDSKDVKAAPTCAGEINDDPPVKRLRRSPQGATLAARRSRFRGVCSESIARYARLLRGAIDMKLPPIGQNSAPSSR